MQVRRLFRRLSTDGPVRSCYEASGAGFVLQRLLADDGFSCEVIAPSLIPRKPGDHRKTDRLDAIMLARLYRSGHLTPVHVPDEDHEALRRLLRLRETYQLYCTATMHRILGILRNHGHVFKEGKSHLDQEAPPVARGTAPEPPRTTAKQLWPSNSSISSILRQEQSAFDAELERYALLSTLSEGCRSTLLSQRRQDAHRPHTPRRDRRREALPIPTLSHGLLRTRAFGALLRSIESIAAPSPRPATSTYAVCWSKLPGTTATTLALPLSSNDDGRDNHPRSLPLP